MHPDGLEPARTAIQPSGLGGFAATSCRLAGRKPGRSSQKYSADAPTWSTHPLEAVGAWKLGLLLPGPLAAAKRPCGRCGTQPRGEDVTGPGHADVQIAVER